MSAHAVGKYSGKYGEFREKEEITCTSFFYCIFFFQMDAHRLVEWVAQKDEKKHNDFMQVLFRCYVSL